MERLSREGRVGERETGEGYPFFSCFVLQYGSGETAGMTGKSLGSFATVVFFQVLGLQYKPLDFCLVFYASLRIDG
jgi:hypothetical protein